MSALVPMATGDEVRLSGDVEHSQLAFGRRTLLTLMGAAVLAACSRGGGSRPEGAQMISYGDDDAQFLELTRPTTATSKGVVAIIHGGFWQSQYDLSLGRPLAASLAENGWTAANLEYRSLGNGGGWPATFDDVAAGIDALADIEGLDTSTVITLGHSAGGHLAVWAAGRDKLASPEWNKPRVPVTAAISQAGVLDFGLAVTENLGGGAVEAFMGAALDEDPERYDEGDPIRSVPLAVPVRCIHARDDTTVPPHQSASYVDAATDAGADATVTMVDGDHFTLIDPESKAWTTTLQILDDVR